MVSVRGSITTTPSIVNYNFAILGGGVEVNCSQVTYTNISFNDGGLAQVTGAVNVQFISCTARNVSRATGNGIFLCCNSSTAIKVSLVIGSCVFQYVTASQASTGGLIFVSNTTQDVSISQMQGLYKLMELLFSNS
jgi:hypothetical protein